MGNVNFAHVFQALVLVYKDLLLFYHEVTQVLARKSTALAWMSEQLNVRIPPVVEDFLRHADQLRQHIDNATAAIIRNIEEWVVEETSTCPPSDTRLQGWLIQSFASQTIPGEPEDQPAGCLPQGAQAENGPRRVHLGGRGPSIPHVVRQRSQPASRPIRRHGLRQDGHNVPCH